MATVNTLVGAMRVPQSFVIDCASTGSNTIINAVPNFAIIVEFYYANPNGVAVALTWKSGSTAISGAMSLAGTGQPLDIEAHNDGPRGVLRCGLGQPLILSMGSGTQVSGFGIAHLE